MTLGGKLCLAQYEQSTISNRYISISKQDFKSGIIYTQNWQILELLKYILVTSNEPIVSNYKSDRL